MKQLTVDILTSALVLINLYTGILSFVPDIYFSNFLVVLIPIPPLITALGLMILGCLLDVLTHKSRAGSLLIIGIFGFAFWALTPNLLLLAVFLGVIAFGQFVLKE